MRRPDRGTTQPARELVEIITPRTNVATSTPAENLLAAISLPEPFSLEIVGTASARWFLARAGTLAARRHLEAQLAVAYPQADLRPLDVDRYPGLDPARLDPSEQRAACTLRLRAPQYLPLRTFRDADIDAIRSVQADPVLGILGALSDLPEGWRGLAQIVLWPTSDDWSHDYLRLAVEHPLASERAASHSDTSPSQVVALAGLLVLGTLGFQAYHWLQAGDWHQLALLATGILTGIPSLVWIRRHLGKPPIYDMRLVQEKVSHIAHRAEIRLAIMAPADVLAQAVEYRLSRLVAAYRQFNLAAGNGLIARPLDPQRRDLRALTPVSRATPILTTRELAGLWHLPQSGADVPLLERTTARRHLPLPFSVADGCRIGVSSHQGRSVQVSLPRELARRHLLLVAKTRRGKSSLLLHLAQHLMQPDVPGASPPCLVLVDPHHDLARAALGLVPAERRDAVVFLDVAERDRPFGLNLLDTGLGWDRDKAVANALTIFRREFGGFWGPRMEDSFRFALLTLYTANHTMCTKEPAGRSRQYTILDIPALLIDAPFRISVLAHVSDPVITQWWSGYFNHLDKRLQIEIVNPVQTKVQRFAGSHAARTIVGQPRSTIDPLSWLPSGAIVIVNTAKGTVGEDTSSLLGATILNLVALATAEQAGLSVRDRRPVSIVVDEFHTMPGADYEGILSELAKYGANLILATQSLARLDVLDKDQGRTLRSMVFANLDGLFAFHTSAEDARYLVPELGGEVDEQDLVALGEHRCYVKLSAAGERLPTFSVHLDPPPDVDPALGDAIAAESNQRFGRERVLVERDLRSATARIEATHAVAFDQAHNNPKSAPPTAVKQKVKQARSKHGNAEGIAKQLKLSAPEPAGQTQNVEPARETNDTTERKAESA